jgi:hypothetical protein
MRNSIVALAALCVFSVTAAAKEEEKDKQDHDELRALLKTFTQAFNTRQLDPLLPYLHKNFSVTMVNQDVVTNPDELKGYLDKQLNAKESPIRDVRIEPQADILTEFYDGRIGVNRGSSTDTYTLKNGRVIVLKTRWSGTAIKDGGKWKVLNAHIGADIVDNPLIDAMQKMKWVWSAVAAGIGLVAGVLGTLLFTRRRGPAT